MNNFGKSHFDPLGTRALEKFSDQLIMLSYGPFIEGTTVQNLSISSHGL